MLRRGFGQCQTSQKEMDHKMIFHFDSNQNFSTLLDDLVLPASTRKVERFKPAIESPYLKDEPLLKILYFLSEPLPC
jgi:hypothetical protein